MSRLAGKVAVVTGAGRAIGRAIVALFLAIKDAQFMTGCSLTPDGGSIIDSGR